MPPVATILLFKCTTAPEILTLVVLFCCHHLTLPPAIAVLGPARPLLDASLPPLPPGPRQHLPDHRRVQTACPPLHRRRLPDDSNILRSSPLSPSLDHLPLRKLIQVLPICHLGADSSIVHLSLRKLI
jgi:hypothetical protein